MNNTKKNEFAFFDVDGTLISMKSMFSFRKYCLGRLGRYSGITGFVRYYLHHLEYRAMLSLGVRREFLNRRYYKNFRGVVYSELITLIDAWWRSVAGDKEMFMDTTITLLNLHKKAGIKTVIVSGSFIELLKPLVNHLGVDHCLATQIEVLNGVVTGKVTSPIMIGQGKVSAVTRFARENNIDLAQCYAYGDDTSDIPMLKLVGHPNVVSSDRNLVKYANLNNWGIVSLTD